MNLAERLISMSWRRCTLCGLRVVRNGKAKLCRCEDRTKTTTVPFGSLMVYAEERA